MRKLSLILAFPLCILALPNSVLAQDAFSDARKSLLAGEVDGALLAVSTGAVAVNTRDEHGYTLLHLAAQIGSIEAVRALLDRGADPTIRANDGSTPETLAKTPEILAELKARDRPSPPPASDSDPSPGK